jgi:hypothetical protein
VEYFGCKSVGSAFGDSYLLVSKTRLSGKKAVVVSE